MIPYWVQIVIAFAAEHRRRDAPVGGHRVLPRAWPLSGAARSMECRLATPT